MKPNHIPITREQLERIYSSSGWEIQEMSSDLLKVIPKIVRPLDILGGYVSGSLDHQPKILNGYASIAAFEVLVFERNPKPEWDEGPVNTYHYVIRESGHHSKFQYILSGPYIDDTIHGHHSWDLDLDRYSNK